MSEALLKASISWYREIFAIERTYRSFTDCLSAMLAELKKRA